MYLQLSIQYQHPESSEILIAELSELNFEGFVEEQDCLKAFITESDLDRIATEIVLARYQESFGLSWTYHSVENENWNVVWESNFEPVSISGKLNIRAIFHPKDDSFPMEIVIQPKMSFGTGHHATTSLVCEILLATDLKNKSVFDFGTGTGILAILAHQLGGNEIWAVDNDPICVENSAENFEINKSTDIHLLLGDINAIERTDFDVIIGNITRNVILHYFPEIASKIKSGGYFIASGFYEIDLEMLKSAALSLGLHLESHKVKDGWCAASFRKL